MEKKSKSGGCCGGKHKKQALDSSSAIKVRGSGAGKI